MQNTFSDDTQLWQQLKLGNKNALESIFRNEADALANYGKKFTADKELIADSLQDLFVELWRT
ncbi:MAG: RNA polymerase sigma factor, partial [Saprospiraceae bacterium]